RRPLAHNCRRESGGLGVGRWPPCEREEEPIDDVGVFVQLALHDDFEDTRYGGTGRHSNLLLYASRYALMKRVHARHPCPDARTRQCLGSMRPRRWGRCAPAEPSDFPDPLIPPWPPQAGAYRLSYGTSTMRGRRE